MSKQTDPWGRDIYWYGTLGGELDAGEGTDFFAVNQSYASITPLNVDMTAKSSLKVMQGWISNMELKGVEKA